MSPVWKYLHLAGEVGQKRDDDLRQYAIGAVAIRPDGVIVSSRNQAARKISPTAHAEYRVLRKAGTGSVVYVCRVRGDGSYALARPCPRCEAALRTRRVTRCHYSIDNSSFGTIEF
jgi:tRNA(Arg) A34 adenosine deaminase TadA